MDRMGNLHAINCWLRSGLTWECGLLRVYNLWPLNSIGVFGYPYVSTSSRRRNWYKGVAKNPNCFVHDPGTVFQLGCGNQGARTLHASGVNPMWCWKAWCLYHGAGRSRYRRCGRFASLAPAAVAAFGVYAVLAQTHWLSSHVRQCGGANLTDMQGWLAATFLEA